MALLKDVIRVAGKKQFINLEVKTPQDSRQRERYQYKECIRLVHELVMMHGIQRDCCVSSFNHELLAELERLNQFSTPRLTPYTSTTIMITMSCLTLMFTLHWATVSIYPL